MALLVGGSDLITRLQERAAFMGGLSIVSGILVAILMPKDAAYGVSEEEKQKKITFKDYVSAFKIPGVWIMAILVWCYVTISAVASYLTPYSTGVLGMSATLAATIGTFRTYGCRLIGGPLGGYLADQDVQVRLQGAAARSGCLPCDGRHFPGPARRHERRPAGGAALLVGIAMFLCKGTYFSIQPEMGIPTTVSATAVAIATFVGYIPDMFVHTMFGNWIDAYGLTPGYTRILIYGVGTGGAGRGCGRLRHLAVQEGRKAQSSRAGCVIRAYYKEAYPHEQDQDQHRPLQGLRLLRERLPRKALSFSRTHQ